MTVMLAPNPQKTEPCAHYQGISIIPSEQAFLVDLEGLMNQPVPVVTDIQWRSFGFVARDNHITKLALHSRGLSRIPDSIGALECLKELYLGNNQIVSLPESLGNLQSLNTLVIDHNDLTALPDSIGNLHGLHTLDISGNYLNALPTSFNNLRGLHLVDLASNPQLRISILLERWLISIRQRGGTIFR